jgi:hypothetical protein
MDKSLQLIKTVSAAKMRCRRNAEIYRRLEENSTLPELKEIYRDTAILFETNMADWEKVAKIINDLCFKK